MIFACGGGTQPTVVIQPPPACAETDPVARALCVVHGLAIEARKNKDVVKLVCVRDKEAQLEALRGRGDDVAEKAASLQHESEQCIGAGPEMWPPRTP